jgi:hypothetical protein
MQGKDGKERGASGIEALCEDRSGSVSRSLSNYVQVKFDEQLGEIILYY